MLLKLDINLFKYLIVVAVLYCLISKIPSENIPFNNKYIFLAFVVFILILTDQTDNKPISIRERFVDTNNNLPSPNKISLKDVEKYRDLLLDEDLKKIFDENDDVFAEALNVTGNKIVDEIENDKCLCKEPVITYDNGFKMCAICKKNITKDNVIIIFPFT